MSSAVSPDVSVVIVNYNTRHLLQPCIEPLRREVDGLRLQILVVDNASRDGSQDLLRTDFTDCEVVFNDCNVGFGRANNQALPQVRGRYLLLLNTDAFVAPDSIVRTVRYLDENPGCGLLGVRLVGRDGSLQPSCRYFPTPWNDFLVRTGLSRWFPGTRLVDDMSWDHAVPRECDWVPGCYYLVRREVLDGVGLFDPRFFMYFEEVDHCKAVKAAGWKVMYSPDTTVVHIGGESARSDGEVTPLGSQLSALQIESSLLYYRKHYGLLGVWSGVLLSSLGNGIVALKWLLKRRTPAGLDTLWKHTALSWTLMRRTVWATQPTR